MAVALPVTVNVPDTIKKYDHISIAIVSTNISESDKLENKIKNDTLHRMSHLNVRFHKLLLKERFEEYMFEFDDYIIFKFPKKYCALNQPDIEEMIGWAVRLNNTGKCLMLNKPKNFFDNMLLKFNSDYDTFINDICSFEKSNIINRDDTCRNRIPWSVWIHPTFQHFYRRNKHKFENSSKIKIICPPGKSVWHLILLWNNSREVITGTQSNVTDRPARFGLIHWSNRRKVKKSDGAMLRRIHKLHEKLKRRKLRRELRIKYKKLKKRID